MKESHQKYEIVYIGRLSSFVLVFYTKKITLPKLNGKDEKKKSGVLKNIKGVEG